MDNLEMNRVSTNALDVVATLHIKGSSGNHEWWALNALASVVPCDPRFALSVLSRLHSGGRVETFTNRIGLRLWRLKE